MTLVYYSCGIRQEHQKKKSRMFFYFVFFTKVNLSPNFTFSQEISNVSLHLGPQVSGYIRAAPLRTTLYTGVSPKTSFEEIRRLQHRTKAHTAITVTVDRGKRHGAGVSPSSKYIYMLPWNKTRKFSFFNHVSDMETTSTSGPNMIPLQKDSLVFTKTTKLPTSLPLKCCPNPPPCPKHLLPLQTKLQREKGTQQSPIHSNDS